MTPNNPAISKSGLDMDQSLSVRRETEKNCQIRGESCGPNLIPKSINCKIKEKKQEI